MTRNATIAQGKHFVKEVIARLKQDDDKAIAEKNARIAIQSVKGQLSALDWKLIKAEGELEKAQGNLHNATYPIVEIESPEDYIKGIKDAKFVCDTATEDYDQLKESIEYFQKLLDKFLK